MRLTSAIAGLLLASGAAFAQQPQPPGPNAPTLVLINAKVVTLADLTIVGGKIVFQR